MRDANSALPKEEDRGNAEIDPILAVCLSLIWVNASLADDPEYVEGEVLVEFSDDVDVDSITPEDFGYESLNDLAELYGVYELEPVFDLPTEPIAHPKGLWTWADWCDMVDECRLEYWFVLRYSDDSDPQSVADAYAADSYTETADVNGLGELAATPNDPYFTQGYQWNLYYPQNRDTDIHAPQGWEHHPFNWALAPMIIGLPDTGVWAATPGNYNTVHEDLRANVIPGAGRTLIGAHGPRTWSATEQWWLVFSPPTRTIPKA